VGLFHPTAMSRVLPVQGILSSFSCSPSSRKRCPLAVVEVIAHPNYQRPFELPPSLHLDFEALFRMKQRCCSLGLTAPQLAPLLRFSSPPGAPPTSPCAPVPQSNPLMTLPAKVFAHTITSPSRLQRDPGEWLAGLSPDCRPARDFRAFLSVSRG
jgi:hypothetical protein